MAVPVALLFVGLPFASAQSKPTERQINLELINKYDPVKVVAIRDRGHSYAVPSGLYRHVMVADGTPDWVGAVSVVLTNQSMKRITAVEFEVDVPAWRDSPTGPIKSISCHVGQLPEHALMTQDGMRIPEESSWVLDAQPGSSFDVPLKGALPQLQGYPLRRSEIEDVTELWVRVQRIFFVDGTIWVGRAYHKPNELHPGVYVPISKEEFNGKQ